MIQGRIREPGRERKEGCQFLVKSLLKKNYLTKGVIEENYGMG